MAAVKSDTRRMVGNFIMGKTLGEGAFSFVKLGVNSTTGEKVALKIFKKDLVHLEERQRSSLEGEINAMKNLRHKNIIALKDFNYNAQYETRDNSKLAVIMIAVELAPGGPFFDLLTCLGGFEEIVARTFFQQLIDGVSYDHDHGRAHRDLKPENLLLDNHFVLKIADFGFASHFSADPASRIMFTDCGTPSYMAPEMLEGNNKAGYDAPMVDIWACGVILFIMIAGFPPFQNPQKTDWWFTQLTAGNLSLFWAAHCRTVAFSEPFKDLINKILVADPKKRYTIKQIKAHSWYCGPTLAPDVLEAVITKKKGMVAAKPSKVQVGAGSEALEKLKLQQKQQQQATPSSPTTTTTTSPTAGKPPIIGAVKDRDVKNTAILVPPPPPPDSQLLPDFNPGFVIYDAKNNYYTATSTSTTTSSTSPLSLSTENPFHSPSSSPLSQASSSSSSPDSSSVVSRPPTNDEAYPAFDADVHPSSFAVFEAYRSPSSLAKTIFLFFKQFDKCSVHLTHDEPPQIRVTIYTNSSVQLEVVVRIYSDKHNKNKSVFEITRRRGNALTYRALFLEFHSLLTDLDVFTPLTSSSSSSPSSSTSSQAPPSPASSSSHTSSSPLSLSSGPTSASESASSSASIPVVSKKPLKLS